MEEKNLVALPDKVADYLEFTKNTGLTLRGALNVVNSSGETKKFIEDYLAYGENQEKFSLAWVNGYKKEEKNFLLNLKILVMFMVILTMK